MMTSLSLLLACLGLHLLVVEAQTVLREQIWSTVIYTLYGDRTPYILPQTNVLTPLGAQQLHRAGAIFRDRYVAPPPDITNVNVAIQGISAHQLNVDQITIQTLADQFIVASAQAFMQGLYPPLHVSSNTTFISGQSELANGSNVVAPLDGYQYPQIYSTSRLDLNSIWISGEVSCPRHVSSRNEYLNSPSYESTQRSNADFYASLQPKLLDGIFPSAAVGYFDAYYIWDYINYGATHNASVSNHISLEDYTRARILADDWVFAMNGNLSAYGSTPGDHIRAIAGRTLATRVVQALYTNMEQAGAMDKMTLLFGSFEPMVAFAALAGLATEQNQQFYAIPEYGSSMVFELFSLSANSSDTYPDPSNLYVRFLFQNGTGENAELISFALFGNSPSHVTMSLTEFIAGMESIMVLSVQDWCDTCSSYSVFCPAFGTDGSTGNSSSSPNTGAPRTHGLKPVVAGVIGAVITLAVSGLVIGAVMLLGGVRVYRRKTKRQSELNGFKGGEKLASDQDLGLAKTGAGPTLTDDGTQPAKAHERVGSWEMGDRKKAEDAQLSSLKFPGTPIRRPSFEEDDLHVTPFADPIKPDDRV